ncbi:rRNA methyltransferase [Brumimicrobium salinarum]|uniref:tRNA (guanosine(18)-2'-O)-methyltransferase n=1 Tax=Brumimicrobium salinarum TaxID=2058658 RepID=A0A2I0R142_9FLAO|nr:RNA methyltransferase [Brumimicrobium salinarum]PKR80289.1 rRNA methyltransferase [Brumimicrobium salinarum]
MNEKLLKALYEIITPEKVEKFDRIAAERTNHVTVAVENLFQEHNASAVMRTCDCFGIQNLHIIEKNNKFNVNKDIAMGAAQWVDNHHYSDDLYPTTKCIQTLKDKGYKIAATTPHTEAYTINNVPIDQPIAFVFGTEQTGLSEKALDLADYFVKIPMVGFTESFNISVSAALTINTIRTRLEHQEDFEWKLSKEEQTLLKIEWCKRIIKNPNLTIKDFKRRILDKEA